MAFSGSGESASASGSRRASGSTLDEEHGSDVSNSSCPPYGSHVHGTTRYSPPVPTDQTNNPSPSEQSDTYGTTTFLSMFTTKAGNLVSFVKGLLPVRCIVNMGLYEDKVHQLENFANSESIPSDHDVNSRLPSGQTPLTLAIYRGDLTAVTELLANPKVDLNYPDKKMYSMDTYIKSPPLIVAVKEGQGEIVEQLLAAGADVNSTDSHRYSVLYYAAEQDAEDIFNCIMRHNPSVTSHEKIPDPLHQACRYGHLHYVKELIRAGADIDPIKGQDIMSPLQMAIQNRHEDVSLYLLTHGADGRNHGSDSHPPFLNACLHGCAKVVHHLLQAGVDVNTRSVCRTSFICALRYADIQTTARQSQISCVKDATLQYINIIHASASVIRLLCESGVHIGQPIDSKSPLRLCLDICHIPGTVLLLKHGATWNSDLGYNMRKARLQMLRTIAPNVCKVYSCFVDNPIRAELLGRSELHQPDNLKDLCRRQVRKCLQRDTTTQQSIFPLIRSLHMPTTLHDYLCYTEIDELALIRELPDDILKIHLRILGLKHN